MNTEFSRAITNGQRAGGGELVGTWGHAKAGFRNCGRGSVSPQRTPGVNSQQNGVTVGETTPF